MDNRGGSGVNPYEHLVIPTDAVHRPARERRGGAGTYKREDYAAHGRALREMLARTREAVGAQQDPLRESHVYLRLEAAEPIQGRRRSLRDNLGFSVVATPTPNAAYVATRPRTFANVDRRLQSYAEGETNQGKSYLSFLERFAPIVAAEKTTEALRQAFERQQGLVDTLIHLFPDLSSAELAMMLAELRRVIPEHGGRFVGTVETLQRGAIIRALLTSDSATYIAGEYGAIYSLDYNAPVYLAPEPPLGISLAGLQPPLSLSNARVCLLDTPVPADHPVLRPYIERDSKAPTRTGHRHAAFVASRIVFGGDIDDQVRKRQLTPRVLVYDAPVFGIDASGQLLAPSQSELAEAIHAVVRRLYRRIKVYNLSLSLEQAIADGYISPLAIELDAIARRYDVLFVVAVGNYRGPLQSSLAILDAPQRIAAPAEAVNSLSVGTICPTEAGALRVGRISRHGPGILGTDSKSCWKPDLVDLGGDLSVEWQPRPELAVWGLDGSGASLVWGSGTSYAAPLVSGAAARILESFPSASANLVRALIIHSATRPPQVGWSEDECVRWLGHGQVRLERALASRLSAATFVCQDALTTRQPVAEIDFRVPNVFVGRSGRGPHLSVRVTVVSSPQTDGLYPYQYCRAYLTAVVRKLSGNACHVEAQSAPCACRGPHSSVINFQTQFSRGFSAGDWQLRVSLESKLEDSSYREPFAAVITVEDPQGELPVYTEIQAEVPNRYRALAQIQANLST